MEDLTGRQFGAYQILAPLGEGGMAAVYKAYQASTDRYVALKVLPHQFAIEPQFVARFQREARLLAQLQHPNILPVFDFGQTDGYTYIVMPFVQGGTLADQLEGEPLSLPRIRQIVSEIGEALQYAHVRGLIHRDIKPSNVLVGEDGHCLLSDFGLARMVDESVKLTTSGSVMGTPAYMSPEQGLGQMLDARSDIYSLGVMLYEMATGRVPYRAETPAAVIIKHIQDPLPPARSLNPELPEAVERVILKVLSKNPADRYQTALEMVQAIRATIPLGSSGTALAATQPAPTPAAATTQPAALQRSWLALPAVLAVIGVGGLLAAAACLLLLLVGPDRNLIFHPAAPTAELAAPTIAAATVPTAVATAGTLLATKPVAASPGPNAATVAAALTAVALESASPRPALPTPLPTASPTPTLPTAVPSPQILVPSSASASGYDANGSTDSQGNVTTFVPQNAVDGRPDTAWRVPGDGQGQWLRLDFDHPVTVLQVGVIPGYAKIDPYDGTDRFEQNYAVASARFSFSDGTATTHDFDYRPEMQYASVGQVRTTFVLIAILSTYPPRSNNPRNFTAISEVQVIGWP